jgi:fructuronate reductase
MHRLSRQTTPVGALLGASSGEAAGIVHLGLGNFHRAHAAVYTAHALAADPGDWGIHGFANRSRDVVSAMSAQDGRYSVLEFSDTGRRAGVATAAPPATAPWTSISTTYAPTSRTLLIPAARSD